MLHIALALTLTAVAWALWIRRGTWRARQEVSATLAIVYQGIGIFLMSPWADPIGAWTHSAIGLWNVEDFEGHCFMVGAACCILQHALVRMDWEYPGQQQLYYQRAVQYPITLALPLMYALYAHSRLSKQPTDPMAIKPGMWGILYWLVDSAILVWLLGYSMYLFRRIGKNRAQRGKGTLYIAACTIGLAGITARIVTLMMGISVVMWPYCAIGITAYAYGFGQSWRAKKRYIRGNPPRATEVTH